MRRAISAPCAVSHTIDALPSVSLRRRSMSPAVSMRDSRLVIVDLSSTQPAQMSVARLPSCSERYSSTFGWPGSSPIAPVRSTTARLLLLNARISRKCTSSSSMAVLSPCTAPAAHAPFSRARLRPLATYLRIRLRPRAICFRT